MLSTSTITPDPDLDDPLAAFDLPSSTKSNHSQTSLSSRLQATALSTNTANTTASTSRGGSGGALRARHDLLGGSLGTSSNTSATGYRSSATTSRAAPPHQAWGSGSNTPPLPRYASPSTRHHPNNPSSNSSVASQGSAGSGVGGGGAGYVGSGSTSGTQVYRSVV